MAHVSWKGNISFGLVNVPVVLFNAETLDKLRFHMLNKKDMAPIKYKPVDSETDREIPRSQVVKGYEYKKNNFVVVTDEDFRKANVRATKTIDIQAFVEASQIAPEFYSRPYYVEPDEKALKSYAILREALKKTGKAAVAKIVMSGKQHLCALSARGDVLILELLRFAHEIKNPDTVEAPAANLKKLGVKDSEIKMAEHLVDEMTEEWRPEQYHDEYQEDLKSFIHDKIKKGKAVEARGEEEEVQEHRRGEVVDFMDLLKKSVKRAGGREHRSHRGG